MRTGLLIATASLALVACGEAPTPESGTGDEAVTETESDTATETATETATDDSGAESAEEAQTTSELAASVAADKADASTIVECNVGSAPGGMSYEGECDMFNSGGASFSVRRVDSQPFFEGITEVIIQADTPTVANMSVRTSDGEMNNYGTAYRESDADECWINDSLDVCVRDL